MKPSSHFDELLLQGWTRRFAACEPRLSEAVAAYEEAGFEVRLEPLPPANPFGDSENGECRVCLEGPGTPFRVIFTRPKSDDTQPDAGSDDLFD